MGNLIYGFSDLYLIEEDRGLWIRHALRLVISPGRS